MTMPLSQKRDLRELAAIRRTERAAKEARFVVLHAQGLPSKMIAERMRVSVGWVNRTLRAAGKAPIAPKDAGVYVYGVPV